MIARTFKYTDYSGVVREQTCLFNLTEAEIMEMQTTHAGGFMEELQRVIALRDQPTIARLLKKFILDSYGERSADGMYFFKEDEFGNPLSRKFKASPAYDELYIELMTDDEKASAFIQGIIPSSITSSKEYQEAYAKQSDEIRKQYVEPTQETNKVQSPPWAGEVIDSPIQYRQTDVEQRGGYNANNMQTEEYRNR